MSGTYIQKRYHTLEALAFPTVEKPSDDQYVISLMFDDCIDLSNVPDGLFIMNFNRKIKKNDTLGSKIKKKFVAELSSEKRINKGDGHYLRFYFRSTCIDPVNTRLFDFFDGPTPGQIVFLVARVEKPAPITIDLSGPESPRNFVKYPCIIEIDDDSDDRETDHGKATQADSREGSQERKAASQSSTAEGRHETEFHSAPETSSFQEINTQSEGQKTAAPTIHDEHSHSISVYSANANLNLAIGANDTLEPTRSARIVSPKGSFEYRRGLTRHTNLNTTQLPYRIFPAQNPNPHSSPSSEPPLTPPRLVEPKTGAASLSLPIRTRAPEETSRRRKPRASQTDSPRSNILLGVTKSSSSAVKKPDWFLEGRKFIDTFSQTSRLVNHVPEIGTPSPAITAAKRQPRRVGPQRSTHKNGIFGSIADNFFSGDDSDTCMQTASETKKDGVEDDGQFTQIRKIQATPKQKIISVPRLRSSLVVPDTDVLLLPINVDPIRPTSAPLRRAANRDLLESFLTMLPSGGNTSPAPIPNDIPIPSVDIRETVGNLHVSTLSFDERRNRPDTGAAEEQAKTPETQQGNELTNEKDEVFNVEPEDSILPDVDQTPQPELDLSAQTMQIDPESSDNEPGISSPSNQRQPQFSVERSLLREAIETASIDTIHEMRAHSLKSLHSLLSTLKKCQKSAQKDDIQRFIDEATSLSVMTTPSVIIGVTGDTGAGKSSLINALLDEEQLLPTDGAQACTAAVILVEYQPYSEERPEPYRAEIEFLECEEWKRECAYLLGEVNALVEAKQAAESDSLREATEIVIREQDLDKDSEVKAVWDKVKAVYSHIKTFSQLQKYTVDSLLDDPTVRHLLGTTRTIKSDSATTFTKEIRTYLVDQSDEIESSDTLQYWPLLKTARLYTRSPLLRSGAVLVDLPGTHDSNAGRSTIAEKFQAQCTHFLVVADIVRAKDNANAQSLFSDLFKGQLAADGMLDKVGFVCTQTELITESETDNLSFPGMQDFRREKKPLEEKLAQREKELEGAGEMKTYYKKQHEMADKRLKKVERRLKFWEVRRESVRKGAEFPVALSDPVMRGKRKRSQRDETESPQKRQKRGESVSTISDSTDEYDDSSFDDSNSDSSSDSDEDIPKPRSAQDKGELKKIITKFRELQKCYKRQEYELGKKIKEESTRKSDLKKDIELRKAKITVLCITARNSFARHAIKHQFAQDIFEADRYAFDNADPSSELRVDYRNRDYDAIAANFPVFCVSSRCYGKLKGRFKTENAWNAFENEEETEIPKLKRHILAISEHPFRKAVVDFSVRFEKFLNSVQIWRTSEEERGQEGTMSEKDAASIAINNTLESMKEAQHSSIASLKTSITTCLEFHILNQLPFAIARAKTSSEDFVARITQDKERKLSWAAFKLICVNHGTRLKRKGNKRKKRVVEVNMNYDLVHPLISSLTGMREKVFKTELPKLIDGAYDELVKTTTGKYRWIQKNVDAFGLNQRQLKLLAKKESLHNGRFETVMSRRKELAQKRQGAIKHLLPIEVKKRMIPGYDAVASCQRKKGIYDEMRNVLSGHLESVRGTMFEGCADSVKRELEKLVEEIVGGFAEVVEEVHDTMVKDLTQLSILPIDTTVRWTRALTKGEKKRATSKPKREVGKVVEELVEGLRKVLRFGEDQDLLQSFMLNEEHEMDAEETMREGSMMSER